MVEVSLNCYDVLDLLFTPMSVVMFNGIDLMAFVVVIDFRFALI